jgi:hypothetical protein
MIMKKQGVGVGAKKDNKQVVYIYKEPPDSNKGRVVMKYSRGPEFTEDIQCGD